MSNSFQVGEPVKVRLWCRDSAEQQASVNTWYYLVTAVGSTPATDQDAANQLDTFLAPLMKALLSTTAEYRGIQVQILNSVPPFAAFLQSASANSNAGPGTVAGGALPTQTAGLLSFQTNLAGRAFRGRFYIPFPGVNDSGAGGSPTAAYGVKQANLLAVIDSTAVIVSGGSSATLTRVLLHKKNKAGGTPAPTPVTAASFSANWATQRKRGNFGRRNTSPV
jgi:hypothetical protein